MSRLYIANVSEKQHVVCYRLDVDAEGNLKDSNRRFQLPKQESIPALRQVQIGGDFHPSQIADIVDQLSPYGLIGVVDVPRIDGRVHELVYNIDQPVKKSVMERVRAHNSAILVGHGQDLRRKAAVATNAMVEKVVAEQFAELGVQAEPTTNTRISFEQDEQSPNGEKVIAEGYAVKPDAPAPKARGSRRRKS